MVWLVIVSNVLALLDFIYAASFLGDDIGYLMIFFNLPGLMALNSMFRIASRVAEDRTTCDYLQTLESLAFVVIIFWVILLGVVASFAAWFFSMMDVAWRLEILLNQIRFIPTTAVLFSMILTSSKRPSQSMLFMCIIWLSLAFATEVFNWAYLK